MKSGSIRRLTAAAVAVLAVTAGACGSSDGASTSASVSTSSAVAAIVVSDPWARATAPGAQVGVIYAQITSTGDADALVGVTVPAAVATEAQLHVATTSPTPDVHVDMSEHSLGGGGVNAVAAHHADGHTEDSPASTGTGMQQVPKLDIPAGGTLELAPGGSHVMLIGLVEPLVAGKSFTATFEFEKAPPQAISVDVRDS